jgi:hypothetical protein
VQCVWFPFNASAEFIVDNLVVQLINKAILIRVNFRVLDLQENSTREPLRAVI